MIHTKDSFQPHLSIKGLIFLSVSISFITGFLYPHLSGEWERLHIFLFNLTSGGTTILYFSEKKTIPSLKVLIFYVLSIGYGVVASLHFYPLAIVLSIVLGIISESIRLRSFPLFPSDFFNQNIHVAKKFHHAALLCLSSALFLAAFVILNNTQVHLFYLEKLTLDVFFLGFSFPVSLITLSFVFSYLRAPLNKKMLIIEEFLFWAINAGVIIFFIFILFKVLIAEINIAVILALSVGLLIYYYWNFGSSGQKKVFLVSAVLFLLATAITGILYLLFAYRFSEAGPLMLNLHAYISLYGWNLTGMAVMMRWNEFPIDIRTRRTIYLHWLLIALVTPASATHPLLAIAASLLFIILVYMLFFVRPRPVRTKMF